MAEYLQNEIMCLSLVFWPVSDEMSQSAHLQLMLILDELIKVKTTSITENRNPLSHPESYNVFLFLKLLEMSDFDFKSLMRLWMILIF